jgi:lipopolysaccharide export system permease protein
MFVFLLQFLMRFIDKLVGKGLAVWTIVQLIGLNLAWMVVLALPMAVLVASLMAFGSLSSANELTAMRSAGVSFTRMLFPIIILGLFLAYLDLRFNNDVLPDANHKAKDLAGDIQRKKPTFSIKAGEFSEDNALPGYSIFAQKTNEKTGGLEGVTIYDHSNPLQINTITAKRATLRFTKDYKNLILALSEGELHQSFQNQPTQYRRGTFTNYEIRIPTYGFDFNPGGESERGDRELSANDLMKYVYSRRSNIVKIREDLTGSIRHFNSYLGAPLARLEKSDSVETDSSRIIRTKNELRQDLYSITDRVSQINGLERDAGSYLVEVHKKYALPVACLVFVLLGAPLGALARRGGIGIGVGLSLGFFILYWACLIGGEKLADRGLIGPWVGMWIANIILGVLGILLCIRVLRETPFFTFSRIFRLRKA